MICALAAAISFADGAGEKALSIASAALHDNMLDIAKTHAEKVVDDDKQPLAVRKKALMLLVQIFNKANDPSAALTALNRGIANQLLNAGETETITLLAKAALDCSDAQQAIDYATSATNRADITLLRILARAERKKGNIDNAIYNYEKVSRLASGREAAENLVEWVDTLKSGNRNREALALLSGRNEITNYPSALYMRGELNLQSGLRHQALADFKCISVSTNISAELKSISLLRVSELDDNPVQAAKAASLAADFAPNEQITLAAKFRLGAILLSQTNTFDEGLNQLKKMIRQVPDTKEAERAQLAIADTLLKNKRFAAAAEQYRIFLESYPKSEFIALAHENRGIAMLNSGKAMDAIQAFRRAASFYKNGPRHSACMMLMGDAYAATRQFREAAGVYDEIAVQDTAPETVAMALFRAGDALERTGDRSGAIKKFESVFTRFPENSMAKIAKFRTANLEADIGNTRDAEKKYDTLITEETNKLFKAQIHMARGRMHYRLFRHAQALQDFATIAEISEDLRDEARFLTILCLYGMGRDVMAREAAENMIASSPGSERSKDAVLWLGKFFFNRGDWKNSRKYFSEYASRWPNGKRVQTARFWAAKSAFCANDYSGCIELISELRKNNPDASRADEALLLQANALIELARFDEAMLLLDRIIVDCPNKSLVREALLRKSDCLFTMGAGNITRYEEALQTYRRCIKDNKPSVPELLNLNFKIARCLEKAGRESEAIDQYYTGVMLRYSDNREKRVRMSDECAALFVRAGFAASLLSAKRGETEKALAILKRVAEAKVPGSREAELRIKALRERKPEEP